MTRGIDTNAHRQHDAYFQLNKTIIVEKSKDEEEKQQIGNKYKGAKVKLSRELFTVSRMIIVYVRKNSFKQTRGLKLDSAVLSIGRAKKFHDIKII